MPSASNICKDRMDIFIQQVKDTHDVVFSTEEERRPDRPAVASFFTEAVSGEDKSAVEKQVKWLRRLRSLLEVILDMKKKVLTKYYCLNLVMYFGISLI